MSGAGGSQTTRVEIPQYLQDAAQAAIGRAQAGAELGYMPYMGPDVAAFTPAQTTAFAANNMASGAFGLPTYSDMGMPQPSNFGGISAYSSYPMYRDAVDQLAQTYPGQMEAYRSLFIDPVTGAGNQNTPHVPQVQNPTGGQPVVSGAADRRDRAYRQPGYGMSSGTPVEGGYTGFRDMIDGGGPGASGATFQGAGLLSNLANAVTRPSGGVTPKPSYPRVLSNTPKV